MKTELVCYCNTNSVFTSNILLNCLLNITDDRMKVISVVETGKIYNKFGSKSRLKRLISLVKNLKILNSYLVSTLSVSIERISKRYCIEYHVPLDLEINSKSHLDYIDSLASKNTNLVAIIFGCPQIFKNDLLNKYKYVLNYHDSYLPYFRGLNATAWSRYENKGQSGYSFHIVNEKVDDGKVVFQELLSYDQNWNIHQHLYNKTVVAGRNIKNLKKFILTNQFEISKDEKYSSQDNYYSEKKKNALIKSSEGMNSNQRQKIEKAFGLKI